MNGRHSETSVQFKGQRLRAIDGHFYEQITVPQLNGQLDKSRRQIRLSESHWQKTKTRKNSGYEPHIEWKLVHSDDIANDFGFLT